MAKKRHIEWRRATEEELKLGLSEMIKVSETEIDVEEEKKEYSEFFKMFLQATAEELEYIKEMLDIVERKSNKLSVDQEGNISGDLTQNELSWWSKMLIKIGMKK